MLCGLHHCCLIHQLFFPGVPQQATGRGWILDRSIVHHSTHTPSVHTLKRKARLEALNMLFQLWEELGELEEIPHSHEENIASEFIWSCFTSCNSLGSDTEKWMWNYIMPVENCELSSSCQAKEQTEQCGAESWRTCSASESVPPLTTHYFLLLCCVHGNLIWEAEWLI